MFSYDVFFNLCESTGITPYRVAKDTGIASTTFSEWKKHCETGGQQGYVPKYDKIVLIANYFDVPADAFFKKEGE